MADKLILTDNHADNITVLDGYFRVKDNFDVIAREITIGGRHSKIYFINGFVKDDILEKMLKMTFTY